MEINMLTAKIVSGLEKVFPDSKLEDYQALERISLLKGERISIQTICSRPLIDEIFRPILFSLSLDGELAKFARVRRVQSVPVMKPVHFGFDEDYLRITPGLFPDVIAPLEYDGGLEVTPGTLYSLFIDIEIPKDSEISGSSILKVSLDTRNVSDREPKMSAAASVEIEIIDAILPEQELLFTQWFHSDCLANYYGVEKWSDEHFRIIENFAKTAKENGINMILTPLITPPLDNFYDTRDIQLADITVTDNGYEFSWDKLGRWIDICNRVGIKYFEIGHLFTQAGAVHATKVSGLVKGEYKRLFPKDTPSDAPEYTEFLRAMLTSFLNFMKARGDDKRCYFHISDEPSDKHIETYTRAKESIADLLVGYPIMDALSHYEFYEKGIVKKPVVMLSRLDDFTEKGASDIWAYTSGSPGKDHSNRLLAMSLPRNRSICLLLYKYGIEGFLHWGYNFYNNSGSCDMINPYLDTSSGDCFPSGDAFSVYPGMGGVALESLRLVSFFEGIEDISAFRLCERLYSRAEVIEALEKAIGKEIKPTTYLNEAKDMHRIREMINSMIKEKL